MEDAMVTIGVPRDWRKMMSSSNAFNMVMVQTRGCMLSSEIRPFSDATFMLPKSAAKSATWLKIFSRRSNKAIVFQACACELCHTNEPTWCY